jgi:SAM-dependent methyltransferase
MNIHPSDLVLEIGSGNNPRPRSDVLCDKLIDDDTERGGSIVTDRPIVEADAHHLPFADSSFGYVISAQVLEHAEDPERMLEELMRVARRGYIETPSELAERLYGWPFHRSVINLVDGRLAIRSKRFTPQFGELFHFLAAHDPLFRRFHFTHNSLFLVQYEWEGRIDYEILPEENVSEQPGTIESLEALRRRMESASILEMWVPFAKSLVPRRLIACLKRVLVSTSRRRRVDLRDIVVCPVCKGKVVWERAEILCSRCGVGYPIVRGIPRLLPR